MSGGPWSRAKRRLIHRSSSPAARLPARSRRASLLVREIKRRPCGAPLQSASPGDALLVATQKVLALTRLLYPYPPTPTSTSRPLVRCLRSTSTPTLVRPSALALSPRRPRTSTSTLVRCCDRAPSPRAPLSPERIWLPRSPLSCVAPGAAPFPPPSWLRAPESPLFPPPPLAPGPFSSLFWTFNTNPSELTLLAPERARPHGRHSCRWRAPTQRRSTSTISSLDYPRASSCSGNSRILM
jgi:hypothetical protein